MWQKILVPLDGSHLSEKALEYARSIVVPGGEIFLLTVVDASDVPVSENIPLMMQFAIDLLTPSKPTQAESSPQAPESDMVTAAEAYLQRVASQLRTASLQVDIGVVEEDSPAEAIIQTALRLRVDAIVLATHGRMGLSRLMLGSVTHKVLDGLPCPVFVIPAQGEREN